MEDKQLATARPPKEGKIERKIYWILAVVIALSGGAATLFLYPFWSNLWDSSSPPGGGLSNFGQYIGGIISSLTGLLTVGFVAQAYLFQRREFIESRSASAEAAEHNARMFRQAVAQNVNHTLFSWLETYDDLLKAILGFNQVGRRALKEWRNHLVWHTYQQWGQQAAVSSLIDAQKKMRNALDATSQRSISQISAAGAVNIIHTEYTKQFGANISGVGTLIQTMYRLLHWIDGRPIDEWHEKYERVAIIRSRLTEGELAVFFLHGLKEDEGKKFAELANKYALFDNLDVKNEPLFRWIVESLNENASLCLYTPSAFSAAKAREIYDKR